MGVKSGVGNREKMEFLNLRRMGGRMDLCHLCHLWQPKDGQERLCWALELPQLSTLNIS